MIAISCQIHIYQRLLRACESGEVDEVMALLTHGISVDTATGVCIIT